MAQKTTQRKHSRPQLQQRYTYTHITHTNTRCKHRHAHVFTAYIHTNSNSKRERQTFCSRNAKTVTFAALPFWRAPRRDCGCDGSCDVGIVFAIAQRVPITFRGSRSSSWREPSKRAPFSRRRCRSRLLIFISTVVIVVSILAVFLFLPSHLSLSLLLWLSHCHWLDSVFVSGARARVCQKRRRWHRHRLRHRHRRLLPTTSHAAVASQSPPATFVCA